ncbi:MAG: lipase family protein [Frankiaceae bacterium]
MPQTIDSAKYGPGDVIAAREIPVTNLTGAKAWRVLYVSIGVDEQTLLPVCGTVVAPDSAGRIALNSGTGNMLAWSHGTVGLSEQCQPSQDPAKGIFGPQSGGIGAVSFGSQTSGNLRQGTAQNGVLQTVINRGWPVAATDYYAGGLWPANKNTMPYVIASMSGAEVLDSTRAAAQLLAAAYGPALAAKSYDVVTWGHSQGGHSAFWAAQLGRSYFAKTAPKQYTPSLRVVGTAVLAPATSFVAGPGDPQSTWGTHLGDREMHQISTTKFGSLTIKTPVGIGLMSFIVGPWPQWGATDLASGAQFPAYPSNSSDIAQGAILTAQGQKSAASMLPQCLATNALAIQQIVGPYADPATNAFFIPQIWGQPGPGGQFQGQLDKTCNTTSNAGVKAWCSWLLYNEPGPAGTSGFDKVPMSADGTPLPVFIAQGENDIVIHCVNTSAAVPQAADCLAQQFFNALSGTYCPGGSAKAALQLNYWRATASSPAGHSDIPGLASNNGQLAFPNSPLDQFLSAVFAGNGPAAGCTAKVINP